MGFLNEMTETVRARTLVLFEVSMFRVFSPLPLYSGGEGSGVRGFSIPCDTLRFKQVFCSAPSPRPSPPEYRGRGGINTERETCQIQSALSLRHKNNQLDARGR